MKRDEFTIGGRFWVGDQAWRCTDIGTRTITVIKLDRDDDPSWYNGPPYAVAEFSFDEDDLEGCTPTPEGDVLPHSGDGPSKKPFAEPGDDQDANDDTDWPSAAEKAAKVAQARALRAQARAGGLEFSTYLPPTLADWLLGLVEQGVFLDPSEAAFVILGEHQELEPHKDLRRELLKRRIQSAIDDPRPSISAEELKAKMQDMFAAPRLEPAIWKKPVNCDEGGRQDRTD